MSDIQSGIDRKTLDHLFENTLSRTEDVFQQILEIFLSESPQVLSEITDAVKAGDVEKAAHLAHKVKSNGLSVGALLFADFCQRIEKVAKDGSLNGVDQWLPQMKEELDLCCQYLNKELQDRRNKLAAS